MAQRKEKTGKELMSELHHTILFLSSMGFDTSKINIGDSLSIRKSLLETATEFLGEPINEVKDAF